MTETLGSSRRLSETLPPSNMERSKSSKHIPFFYRRSSKRTNKNSRTNSTKTGTTVTSSEIIQDFTTVKFIINVHRIHGVPIRKWLKSAPKYSINLIRSETVVNTSTCVKRMSCTGPFQPMEMVLRLRYGTNKIFCVDDGMCLDWTMKIICLQKGEAGFGNIDIEKVLCHMMKEDVNENYEFIKCSNGIDIMCSISYEVTGKNNLKGEFEKRSNRTGTRKVFIKDVTGNETFNIDSRNSVRTKLDRSHSLSGIEHRNSVSVGKNLKKEDRLRRDEEITEFNVTLESSYSEDDEDDFDYDYDYEHIEKHSESHNMRRASISDIATSSAAPLKEMPGTFNENKCRRQPLTGVKHEYSMAKENGKPLKTVGKISERKNVPITRTFTDDHSVHDNKISNSNPGLSPSADASSSSGFQTDLEIKEKRDMELAVELNRAKDELKSKKHSFAKAIENVQIQLTQKMESELEKLKKEFEDEEIEKLGRINEILRKKIEE